MYYIVTGLSGSATTWTPPKELAKYAPSSNTVTVKLTVQTIKSSDGSQVGIRQTECKLTIPSSVAPSVSLTVSDATDYKDTFGSFVQSLSRFRVQATFKGAYKSTMRSYSLTITGMGTYSDMDTTTGVIPTAGSITLKATVTDSRGNTGTASVTVSVVAPRLPCFHLLHIILFRTGADYNYGKYSNADVDALVAQLDAEFDPAKRVELALEMQKLIVEDCAWFTLGHLKFQVVSNAKVTGYETQGTELYLLTANTDIAG